MEVRSWRLEVRTRAKASKNLPKIQLPTSNLQLLIKGATQMKKIVLIFALIIFLLFPTLTYAEEVSQDEIVSSQKEVLNIPKFISESKKYTEDVFGDVDYGQLLNSAITGNVDNKLLGKSILNLIGKETIVSIRVIASIMVIVIIHSILKSISEGLENQGITQITYYVQYILIVTLIMTNFADVVTMVKDSINNLVNFSNCLVPLLTTLMLSTGSIASVNLLQPILLFLITFIGNFINAVIIPITLVATSLSIVSKISDRIQLDKLAKFFKSSVVWVLGVVLTLFVGLLSLEGTLRKYSRWNNSKNNQSSSC